ncbi:MAG TPA: hypothetical protein VK150_05245 [Geothrix sp.]|nr:hypothetical protein [Geothrix sp.]
MTIPRDKILHSLAGLLAGAAIAIHATAWWEPLAAAALLGILKEGFDAAWNRWVRPEHSVDLFDALATTAGGIIPALVLAFRA